MICQETGELVHAGNAELDRKARPVWSVRVGRAVEVVDAESPVGDAAAIMGSRPERGEAPGVEQAELRFSSVRLKATTVVEKERGVCSGGRRVGGTKRYDDAGPSTPVCERGSEMVDGVLALRT